MWWRLHNTRTNWHMDQTCWKWVTLILNIKHLIYLRLEAKDSWYSPCEWSSLKTYIYKHWIFLLFFFFIFLSISISLSILFSLHFRVYFFHQSLLQLKNYLLCWKEASCIFIQAVVAFWAFEVKIKITCRTRTMHCLILSELIIKRSFEPPIQTQHNICIVNRSSKQVCSCTSALEQVSLGWQKITCRKLRLQRIDQWSRLALGRWHHLFGDRRDRKRREPQPSRRRRRCAYPIFFFSIILSAASLVHLCVSLFVCSITLQSMAQFTRQPVAIWSASAFYSKAVKRDRLKSLEVCS